MRLYRLMNGLTMSECATCRHHAPQQYIKHGVCQHPRSYKPFGAYQAAVVAIRNCGGKFYEARK